MCSNFDVRACDKVNNNKKQRHHHHHKNAGKPAQKRKPDIYHLSECKLAVAEWAKRTALDTCVRQLIVLFYFILYLKKKEATRIVENRHMPLALLLLCQLLDNTLDSFSLPLSAFQRPFAIFFVIFYHYWKTMHAHFLK